MFAKKVLISLALVAATPLVLSRHVRVFPDDLVRNFPPANIEDLHISQGDVIPDIETQPDFGEDDTQDRIQNIFGGKMVPNYDDAVQKVRSIDVHPEIEDIDYSDDDANNQNNYPNQDEVMVPQEKLDVRQRQPVVIMVPSDEQTHDYPEYPEGSENKNEDVQTWDDDEDANEIPQAVATRNDWNSW